MNTDHQQKSLYDSEFRAWVTAGKIQIYLNLIALMISVQILLAI